MELITYFTIDSIQWKTSLNVIGISKVQSDKFKDGDIKKHSNSFERLELFSVETNTEKSA